VAKLTDLTATAAWERWRKLLPRHASTGHAHPAEAEYRIHDVAVEFARSLVARQDDPGLRRIA
jgi:hypothetical protein